MASEPQRDVILALVGQNENQVLQGFAESNAHWFSVRGYRQHIVDMLSPTGNQELKQYLSEGRIAFAYAFAGVGSQFSFNNGINIWTAARTPFVALWHDHPAYNYPQHIVDSPYVGHLYHVADHREARARFLPTGPGLHALAKLRYNAAPPEHRPPLRDRRHAIYFVKTGHNPESIAAGWKDYPQPLQDVLWALFEEAKKDSALNLTERAAAYMRQSGHPPEDYGMLMGIVAEVDNYIRVWRSDRMARALLPHPAVIVGGGWDYLRTDGACAEFLPPISLHTYLQNVPGFRIVANTSPLWRDGLHERAYFGIHHGCLTLTDRTRESDRLFAGLPNYLPFEWQDDLQDVIAETLRKAEDVDADYYPAAEHQLASMAPPDDYFVQIEQFADAIRQHAEYASLRFR